MTLVLGGTINALQIGLFLCEQDNQTCKNVGLHFIQERRCVIYILSAVGKSRQESGLSPDYHSHRSAGQSNNRRQDQRRPARPSGADYAHCLLFKGSIFIAISFVRCNNLRICPHSFLACRIDSLLQ